MFSALLLSFVQDQFIENGGIGGLPCLKWKYFELGNGLGNLWFKTADQTLKKMG